MSARCIYYVEKPPKLFLQANVAQRRHKVFPVPTGSLFQRNEHWESHFSGLLQSVLPKPVSNQSPILLARGYNVRGSFSHVLVWKLKALKHDLKAWNKEVFRNAAIRKAGALNQIRLWDSMESKTVLCIEEVEARRLAVKEHNKWVILEEISWRQKLRELQLRKGDKNTGYVYKMVNAWRIRKYMARVTANGSLAIRGCKHKARVANVFHSSFA
ncbi:hypothetical protein CK203_105055 [Vitis vinifera]|uniref:Uncharacterized protein n=1 Tax=Vitis vinifera TaxID=29760 RepID=A0A438FEB7_VITVI|nr:hypothetical protein CK203_105055 [Vitis vinifera]